MNFQQSNHYLLSLGNEVSAMKLGLESIRKLLAALGDPHEGYLKVQVAGTNGKGSVCAFLNSICVTAGIETGMYTSPHLISITERVKVNGVDIGEDDFARVATRVREVAENLVESGELESVPTFFEQVTAIALLAFSEAKVELAILETGLGGRLDATTAANAEIAAITRIDYDHQQYLGETIEEIAAEKAAIIHEGSQVVVGEQEPAAMRVVVERCRALGIKPRFVTASSNLTSLLKPHEETPSLSVEFPPLGLAGRHQIENARLAVAVAQIIGERYPITEANISRGLQEARHPGRLEWNGRFLFDGAHNVGGARALRNYLDEFVIRPITMVFGAMSDKQISEIADVLFSKADRLVLTTPQNSRAMKADELLKFVPEKLGRDRVFVTAGATAAIKTALEMSAEEDTIVITGSLYLVGEAQEILATVHRE